MPQVEVRLSGGPSGTEVIVDGVKVPRVRKVTIVHEYGHAPVVTIEAFMLDKTVIAGEADVVYKPVGFILTKPYGRDGHGNLTIVPQEMVDNDIVAEVSKCQG